MQTTIIKSKQQQNFGKNCIFGNTFNIQNAQNLKFQKYKTCMMCLCVLHCDNKSEY